MHYARHAGEMLWAGSGAARDRVMAMAWMDLAAERGYDSFTKKRDWYWQQLSEAERFAFADTIKRLTSKYYNLFKISFTYSAGIYQSPVNDGDHPEWHLHMHFYPPLLSSDVRMKYNDMNNPLAALNAEWAAEKLKCVSEVPCR